MLKELSDWSFQSYKDDITSNGDNIKEPMASWNVRKKHKRLASEKPDQQTVKDLILNIEQHTPAKQSEGDRNSTESFIKEAFRSSKASIISGLKNYSRISNPNNS